MYPEAIGKHNMSSVSLINRGSECDHNAKKLQKSVRIYFNAKISQKNFHLTILEILKTTKQDGC